MVVEEEEEEGSIHDERMSKRTEAAEHSLVGTGTLPVLLSQAHRDPSLQTTPAVYTREECTLACNACSHDGMQSATDSLQAAQHASRRRLVQQLPRQRVTADDCGPLRRFM